MGYTNAYLDAVSQIFTEAMHAKGYNRKTLIEEYKKAFGKNISQATLTNIFNHGNASLSVYLELMELLEIDLFQKLSDLYQKQHSVNIREKEEEYSDIFIRNIFNERHTFIVNPNDPVFDGYGGEDYHTYFYQTIAGREQLLYGILHFDRTENDFFKARFSLHTGDYDDNGEIIKEYEGYLIYSVKSHVVSCLLLSGELGEVCLIKFNHIPINRNKLVCRMALAITASAGNPKLPTVHRLFFTRSKLSEEEQENLKGQLLMNSSSFVVSEKHLMEFISQTELPPAFREVLENALSQDRYVKINESSLLKNADSHPSAQEINALNRLRKLSEEVRYNKISSHTDEYTFRLYAENSCS